MWTQARIDELLQERKTQSPSAVLSLEAELEHTRSALSQVTAVFHEALVSAAPPTYTNDCRPCGIWARV